MLCPRCATDNRPDAHSCANCGATLLGPQSIPPAERISDQTVPERKEATLLFADIGGYSAWTNEADVEEVAEVMEAIKERASQIVHAHGGVVNQFVGDEIMAVFGIPVAHEDDPRRAVAAALELHGFLRSAGDPRIAHVGRKLSFHTGIATGLVLAQSRDVRDGVFDLTGQTVNLGARLRSLAKPDEILVSDETRRRVEPVVRTESLEPRSIKGTSAPITPHRVVAQGDAHAAVGPPSEGLPRHIGRDEELAQFADYLDDVEKSDARLVTVEGAPGVGKTRLMHDLREKAGARDFKILRGQCQSYGNIPPFQPFLETLEDALGLHDLGAPDAADRLIESAGNLGLERHVPIYLYLLSLSHTEFPLADGLTGPALRRGVIEALGDILVALSERAPVLVIVEDWHWADEASDTLFRELARATVGRRIIAVITYRSDQVPRGRRPLSNRQIELRPLPEADARALLEGQLHTSTLPPGLADYVYESTDGNPLFIEEMCRSLQSDGVLEESGGAWQLRRSLDDVAAPTTVQAVVRARIDRLEPDDKASLKLASVVGPTFSVELLRTIDDRPALSNGSLPRLEAQAHVARVGADIYRFKHAIVQDVAYNMLLLRERRRLHGQLARAIEAKHERAHREQPLETLAHHYYRGGLQEQAAVYAELAGDKARRSFSLDQARRQYRRAMDALDALPETNERRSRRVAISLRWAGALVHNPEREQLKILQRSLDHATALDDRRAMARLLSWIAWVEYTLGNQQQAIALNEECISMAEAADDAAVQFQARASIGMSYVIAADYDSAERFLTEVAALRGMPKDAVTSSVNQGGFGYALAHFALLHADRGEFDAARRDTAEAREWIEASGQRALLGPIATIEGMACSWLGDWAGCRAAADEVARVAERIDGPYLRHMSLSLEGTARFHEEASGESIEMMRSAARFLESRQLGLALSWALGCLAEALALAGQSDEAIVYAEKAIDRAEHLDGLGHGAALRARAIARAALGESYEADFEASIHGSRKKRSPRDGAMTELRWADVLSKRGRASEAAERAGRALDAFYAMGMNAYADRARALTSADE